MTKISDSIYQENTAVTKLVDEIQEMAEKQGLTLSRWQTNGMKHTTTITYAIHTGERAARFNLQDNVVRFVILSQLEGKTEKCEAWCRLTSLHNYLNN